MIDNSQSIEYIPSQIIEDRMFKKSISRNLRGYVDKLLKKIKEGLNKYGANFFLAKKNVKSLVGGKDNTWEFRSIIKGHRILFKFAYQLKNDNSVDKNIALILNKLNDKDIILLKYIGDHDDISKGRDRVEKKKIVIEDLDERQIEFDVSEKQISNSNIKEIHTYRNINYLVPLLNNQQNSLIYDKKKYVLVQGIAGSGKTNICIQKCLLEALKDCQNKVLYSTYSKELLEFTKNFIYENYVLPIQEIINEFNKNNINFNAIDAMKNSLNLDLYSLENNKASFENVKEKILSIDYKFLSEFNKNNIADFKYFNDFISQKLTFDLRDSIKKAKISNEIIFREVEGLIFGLTNSKNESKTTKGFKESIIDFDEYKKLRKNDFKDKQLELVYKVSKYYLNYLLENKNITSKNIVAFNIYRDENLKEKYDIAILDEVQDFTEKELIAFKHIATNIFAVGDMRQTINPNYFSFNSLKNTLGVKYKQEELTLNYRNTENLNDAVKSLIKFSDENLFGKWNDYANKIETTKSSNISNLCFTKSSKLLKKLLQEDFENYTLVVPTEEQKEKITNAKPDKVKTVSEIKGKEEEVIILYNVLSNYKDQWDEMAKGLNHNEMEVNSLFRYYFNIFYVGITRAERHILIVEEDSPQIFRNFFTNFEEFYEHSSVLLLKEKLGLDSWDDETRLIKIEELIDQKQYKVAEYHSSILQDKLLQQQLLNKINIFINFVEKERYHDAREKFLENNFYKEAKDMCLNLQEFEEALLLDKLFINNLDLNYSDLFKTLMSTKSKFIKNIVEQEIKKHREKTIEYSLKLNQELENLNERK